MKLYRFIFLAVLISGCSGWNSELDTQYIPDPTINAKPKCQFKIKDNCWTRSLQLIAACAPEVGQTDGVLTEDLRFCSHSNGDFVEFINPNQIVDPELTGDIEINVYSKNKRCYHFKRQGNEITIDQNPYGEISSIQMPNGDIQVSCLFGESFVVPSLVKEKGCRNEKAAVSEFTPGVELVSASSDSPAAIDLIVLGTGIVPLKILSCRK